MKKLILLIVLAFSLNINAQVESKNKSSKIIETVYNDSKTGITTVYNDLKSTTPQIKTALESLSKELKTTTDSLWLILVKQQLVWSWCFLILTLSAMINWYMFYKKAYPSEKDIEWVVLERDIIGDVVNPNYDNYYAEKPNYKHDIRAQLTIKAPIGKEQYNAPKDISLLESNSDRTIQWLHFFICLVLSGLSVCHFSDMLTGFINPEFGALKTITEVVKTLK